MKVLEEAVSGVNIRIGTASVVKKGAERGVNKDEKAE
jgi:hypothetical protein